MTVTTTHDTDAVPLVTLDELAARCGQSVEAVYARLESAVRRDWAGRPCVTAAAARAYVEECEEARRRYEEVEYELRDFRNRWQQRRDEVWANAFNQAKAEEERSFMRWAEAHNLALPNGPVLDPDAFARIQRRAREALAAWEAKHPCPPEADLEHWAKNKARYEGALKE